MAEELIYCPQCRHKLRVPETLLGQLVQCPLCRLIFTSPRPGGTPAVPAPAPGATPAGEAEAPAASAGNLPADSAGAPPAPAWPGQPHVTVPPPWYPPPGPRASVTALVVPPAVSLLLASILGIAVNGLQVILCLARPEMFQQPTILGPPPPVELITISGAIFAAINLLIALSGLTMLFRRVYVFCFLGAILALVNIGNLCCLLTLPVGVWALIVLCLPDVRNTFQ
jgi:hypothetical protein